MSRPRKNTMQYLIDFGQFPVLENAFLAPSYCAFHTSVGWFRHRQWSANGSNMGSI